MIKAYGVELDNPRFSLGRTLNVARRVLRQITRDHKTFAMIVIMPLVVMFIFGVALSGEVKNTPVYIENADTGTNTGLTTIQAGDELMEELQDDDRLRINGDDYLEGIEEVEDGKAHASVLIPTNFSESIVQLSQGANVSVVLHIYIDGTSPQIRANIMAAIQESIQDALGDTGIKLETEFAFGGAEFSGLETSTPAVMGYVLSFLVLLLSMLVLIRERIEGTEMRLYTTPLRARERLLGYLIALTIFGMIEAGSILLISTLLFQVPVKGSLSLLIISASLYAMVNVSLAVMMSNIAENELQAVQMAALTALPSLALAGLLVPISSLPAFLQPISIIIPLTYAIIIFEGIMLKGHGLEILLPEFLILVAILLLLTILSFITVKDSDE